MNKLLLMLELQTFKLHLIIYDMAYGLFYIRDINLYIK